MSQKVQNVYLFSEVIMYSRFLVLMQFIFMGLILYPFFGNQSQMAGLLFIVVGGVVGLWTMMHNRLGNFNIIPEPKDGCVLIQTGPYQYVRNPMYTSLLLTMAGVVVFYGQIEQLIFLFGLLVILVLKVRKEEVCLKRQFTEYEAYMAKVKRFIPGLL